MFYYAVLATETYPDKLKPLIQKAGEILGSRSTLRTTPHSNLGCDFNRYHNGNKYSYYPESRYQDMINIEPTNGAQRQWAIRNIRGFARYSAFDKALAHHTLSCLFGYQGCIKSLHTVKFMVTYTTSNLDSFVPSNLALIHGIKVFNLNDSLGATKFYNLLCALK